MPDQTKSRYLDYLPAIYQGQENAYLGEFLLPFEQVFTDIEDLLAVIDRYFAPALTAPDFLPWLAKWVALVLDDNWNEAKRRQLIAEALELHRLRGTIAGIRRYLQIYDNQYGVQFRESAIPGGVQIGVASRIGGIAPNNNPQLTPISLVKRQTPLTYHDYYVVTTAANPGRPGHPAEVQWGQPLQLYYRADRVKRVRVGTEAEKQFVELRLLDGEVHRHVPAEVSRRDGLIDDRYRLTREGCVVTYQGDTFLIEETEQPYQFTVEVQAPTGWQFLFEFPISFADDGLLEKAFREAFSTHVIILPDSIDIRMSKPGRQWQITDGEREYTIRRKPLDGYAFELTKDETGVPLHLFRARLSFDSSDDKEAIERRILSEFRDRGVPLSSNAHLLNAERDLHGPWEIQDGNRKYTVRGNQLEGYVFELTKVETPVPLPLFWVRLSELFDSSDKEEARREGILRKFRTRGVPLKNALFLNAEHGLDGPWEIQDGDRKYTVRSQQRDSGIFEVTQDKDAKPLFEVSLDFDDFDIEVIKRRILLEFKNHRFPLSPNAQLVSKDGALRWLEITGEDKQQYVIAREGIVLRAYRWLGQGEWTKAMQPDNVRAIRAIIDEVKPAHTLYYLELTPKSDLRALLSMQIGVRSTVDVDSTIG